MVYKAHQIPFQIVVRRWLEIQKFYNITYVHRFWIGYVGVDERKSVNEDNYNKN